MNIYMDCSYNYGMMAKDHGPHSRHTDIDGRERCTEVTGTPCLGFSFIVAIGSTSPTIIGQAIIINGKGAEFFLFGCQHVSSNVKLMGQLIMGGL